MLTRKPKILRRRGTTASETSEDLESKSTRSIITSETDKVDNDKFINYSLKSWICKERLMKSKNRQSLDWTKMNSKTPRKTMMQTWTKNRQMPIVRRVEFADRNFVIMNNFGTLD